MWTPKRILLLSVGFLGFMLLYLVYSMTTLGRINTLPPLPERYRSNPGDVEVVRPLETMPSPLKIKLERAFGRDCKEKDWPVQLELNSRSMVIAAENFQFEPDGRMRLENMSIALFGKKKNDSQDIEINTLKCRLAYITFDRPVTSLAQKDLDGRKVVEAELHGKGDTPIVIENNRRTSRRDDDLRVTINHGPLYYHEAKQLICTNDFVKVLDGYPPKADIEAKGMAMELATTAPPVKPGAPVAAKPKTDNISGVKRIALKQDVTMHLFVSGGTPFPGGGAKDRPTPAAESKNAPAAKPPEPSHIIIHTPGRFQYDFFKDHDLARFDVPDDDQANRPQDVTVERITKEDAGSDQLVCKHLELRLKRHTGEAKPGKAASAETPAQSPEQELEIETAHATGPNVTLTSDAEKLDAHGNDFFHDAAKKLTILKGTPFMEANKEESLIQAPELHIRDVPLPRTEGSKGEDGQPKTYQQIHASGPGRVHMLNKTTGKRNTHAYWNKQLISTRDGELDLLILTGEARFVDDEHKQSLQADTLKVWLLAEDKKAEATAKKPEASPSPQPSPPAGGEGRVRGISAVPEQSRRPYRIEALRNVEFHSPELNIPAAGRLLVRFTDVPPERMPPPSASNAKTSGPQLPPAADAARPVALPTSPATQATPPTATAAKPKTTPAPASSPSKTPGAPPPTEPTKQPINLTAQSIEAEALRCGERVVLDHLWAEGSPIDKKGGVQVRQEPAKPGERGVYIEGNALDMKCYPEGNVLDVTGDLAKLLMDKIIILGPDVHIDQTRNQASVKGQGAMEMQSSQTLEGKPLEHPVPLTVHWSDDMVFAGEHAEFHGDIEATQKEARLACQYLQVFFDRPISLKEGARSDQPAKVRSLVGDKDVRVEDKEVVLSKLQKYQLLTGSSITSESEPRDDEGLSSSASGSKGENKSNDANKVTLSALPQLPGTVRLWQRGGADPAAAPGRATSNRPATSAKQTPLSPSSLPSRGGERMRATDEQEMKLTYVRFTQLMKASSRTDTASFWGSVEVLNFPCDDPYREIDLDTMRAAGLPAGAMYLRSDRLTVHRYQKTVPSPEARDKSVVRNYQEMEAHGKVIVQGKDFFARADSMTFNEEKDQVIFIGENGRPAVLERRFVKGGEPEVIRSPKIFYIRSTGDAWADKIDSIDVPR